MRINKFLANAGVSSRRNADALIEQGKVFVNGKRIGVGFDVNEVNDKVTVDGKQITLKQEKEYFILNKPKGYLCTVSDDKGRKTIMELLPKSNSRVYPVGRLDYETEGLLIVTNDGEMTDRLTHPRNEVPKTYLAKVDGVLGEKAIATLKSGVEIEPNVLVRAQSVRITETNKDYTKFEITICEGKNRQVRRMLEAVGKEVTFLKRIKIGDLRLSGLDRGQARRLTAKEIDYLKNI